MRFVGGAGEGFCWGRRRRRRAPSTDFKTTFNLWAALSRIIPAAGGDSLGDFFEQLAFGVAECGVANFAGQHTTEGIEGGVVLLTTIVLPLLRMRPFLEEAERGAFVLCLP